MSDDKDRLVQLWQNHSNHFWEQVRTVALVEAGLVAGWYTVRHDIGTGLARVFMGLGAVILMLIVLMLYRHSQYVDAFRKAAGDAIPDAPAPLFSLKSSSLAILITILLVVFNLVLCIFGI